MVLSVRAYCSGDAAVVRRGRRAHRLLAVEALEQRALGVDAELVAVAGDRGVEDPGVRGEDERRELRQRRVEQELRLHRVPVLRVEVGSGRAEPVSVGGETTAALVAAGGGRVVGVAAGEQRGRAAGQTGAQHGASGREGHCPS